MTLHMPSLENGKDFGYDDIEGGNLLGNLLGSLQEIFSGNSYWDVESEFGWHLPLLRSKDSGSLLDSLKQ